MNNKPTLRERRRAEAREALYRAIDRRDRIIDSLVRNTNQIKKLKRALKQLETPRTDPNATLLAVSVAEGKVLEKTTPGTVELPNDDIPDWPDWLIEQRGPAT